MEILPVDALVAGIYGEIIADLRTKGCPLPANDVWIAATAARAGSSVLTFDERLESVARVGSLVLAQPST